MLFVGIWQNRTVVLGCHVGLDTFSTSSTTCMDMVASLATTHERNSTNRWIVTDKIDGIMCTMDDVKYTIRYTCFFCESCQNHSSTRIAFRRLQHHGVSSSHSQRKHPKWNHGWKVKWANSSGYTKRLTIRNCIHFWTDVGQCLAHQERTHTTCMFDNLESTKYITFCIRQCLSLLSRNALCKFVCMFHNQVLKAKHDRSTTRNWSVAPTFESFSSTINSTLHFFFC
mmetsp:Transcript_21307/g.31702  ORF Transcript_21307/g.31702 Transcript_21307/m.31702 type:complete len:227 (-) Transcript_21307:177-857(-)